MPIASTLLDPALPQRDEVHPDYRNGVHRALALPDGAGDTPRTAE
jgi:hypothetical protein